MDSLSGQYGPVDIDLDERPMGDHKVWGSEGRMCNGKCSSQCGKRWACVAGSTVALSGLLWVVANCLTRVPPAAGATVDFDSASIDVELPRQKAVVINVTKAALPHSYVEWVVVNPIANVRSSNSLTAQQIGIKEKGAIVIGDKQGDWVKLAQTGGWMVIALGGKPLLQSRTVNYFHVQSGSCKDMAAFSIDDKHACMAAASYLGYQTPLGDVETYKGKAQRPQGCYAEGRKILFVPGQAICGDHDGCKSNLMKRPNLWEPLCSSKAYPRWMSGNGYMDSSAIATRVAVNKKHMAKVFKACPAPTTQCTILWPVSINNFVRIGFGASIGFFCPAQAYFATIGCKFAVAKGFASHWKGTGFAPFWNEELPDAVFHTRWNQGGDCGGMYWMRHFKPMVVKCEMPPAFISTPKYDAFLRSPQYNGQLFDGWSNLYLQSFGPRLSAYRLPYNHSFAAFHVRKGDKEIEIRDGGNENMFQKSGSVEGLLAILNQYWPHITSVFIATDDSNTVEQAAKAVHDKYNITWSANAARYPGGSPMAQFENHASNDGAVNGVLDDQAGLASANVLIGASDSGFFNVARTLNIGLHKGMPRLHPWCYDVYRRKICD